MTIIEEKSANGIMRGHELPGVETRVFGKDEMLGVSSIAVGIQISIVGIIRIGGSCIG